MHEGVLTVRPRDTTSGGDLPSAEQYLAPDDERRCTLERFVRERWQAGETDLDELTCSGLSFLSRLQVLPEHR